MRGHVPPGTLRLTTQTRAVAEAIRDGHTWGTAIIAHTGMSMSGVYAVLRRMREAGWATATAEPADQAHAQARPARTLYELTVTAADALGWPRPAGPTT
ncbi:hypothetical protein [Actinoplanes sp. NBRC 101535]|uniref:hypothetical protein n=1 Tax=Actinoplanes sp. NBRC 101535 TaxID=3032196 RepID=UPI0024A5974F|nr:hypothetical protein [Actinoplanes sp. NBRC 101535]GLY08233.1 hypothetical protein Acsp01_86120 [Actinoplanes sp. NBRC 101535]